MITEQLDKLIEAAKLHNREISQIFLGEEEFKAFEEAVKNLTLAMARTRNGEFMYTYRGTTIVPVKLKQFLTALF